MYGFDLGQQFGWLPLPLAVVGAARLIRVRPPAGGCWSRRVRAALVFALSYNVGDAHVFFLPSHLMIALLVAPGLASLGRWTGAPGMAAAPCDRCWPPAGCTRLPGARPQRRSTAGELLAELTAGLDDRTRAPDRSELAGAERSVLLRQADAARAGVHARWPTCCSTRRRSFATTSRSAATSSLTARAREPRSSSVRPAVHLRARSSAHAFASVARRSRGACRRARATCSAFSGRRASSTLATAATSPISSRGSAADACRRSPADDYAAIAGLVGRSAGAGRGSQPSVPAPRRARRRAGRRPHGVVAGVRHDPAHGLRPRRRRPAAYADRRTRRQLRGVRRGRRCRSSPPMPPASSPRTALSHRRARGIVEP